MDRKKWDHKITSGLTGVILSLVLLMIFGGLAIWLQDSQKEAVVLSRILVAFAGFSFALALYRALFFKVLIDKEGFFYQTAPGNGRYYHYCEIRKIWLSSGKETTAQQITYCNFETKDGKISRFFFMGINMDAVDHLIKQVEAVGAVDNGKMKDDDLELTISGKVQGGSRMIIVAFVFLSLFLLTNSLVKQGLPPITFLPTVVMGTVSIIASIVHSLFYKIQIRKDGFYCRTTPFDGKYYKYSDIANCKLIEKRKKYGSIYRGNRRTRYFYFLVFTDATNKTHKILYNKSLFEREMKVLVSRIEQENTEKV